MAVDAAGDNSFGALHQRVTVLKCVGFHGNSCAMIFAAVHVRSAVGQTVSENPIWRRERQPCKIERAVSCATHGPSGNAIKLDYWRYAGSAGRCDSGSAPTRTSSSRSLARDSGLHRTADAPSWELSANVRAES